MAHFLGTGGQDVGRALSMLGICGGISFKRNFHNHSLAIGRKIVKICDEIIQEAKNEEIIQTIIENQELQDEQQCNLDQFEDIKNNDYSKIKK